MLLQDRLFRFLSIAFDYPFDPRIAVSSHLCQILHVNCDALAKYLLRACACALPDVVELILKALASKQCVPSDFSSRLVVSVSHSHVCLLFIVLQAGMPLVCLFCLFSW